MPCLLLPRPCIPLHHNVPIPLSCLAPCFLLLLLLLLFSATLLPSLLLPLPLLSLLFHLSKLQLVHIKQWRLHVVQQQIHLPFTHYHGLPLPSFLSLVCIPSTPTLCPFPLPLSLSLHHPSLGPTPVPLRRALPYYRRCHLAARPLPRFGEAKLRAALCCVASAPRGAPFFGAWRAHAATHVPQGEVAGGDRLGLRCKQRNWGR